MLHKQSVQLQTHSCCNRNQLKSTWSVQLLFNYYSINLNNQFNYTLLHIFSAYSSSAYWFKAQKVLIQSTLWYSASLILCILIFKMWTDSKHTLILSFTDTLYTHLQNVNWFKALQGTGYSNITDSHIYAYWFKIVQIIQLLIARNITLSSTGYSNIRATVHSEYTYFIC